METAGSKSKLNPSKCFRHKRGKIKIKIIKGLVKSLASLAGCGDRRPREDGGFLSPQFTNPAQIPSGFCSGTQSDGSGPLS